MDKTCIIIAGPTAVGKTALALQLAQYFSTEIISADSRQCYKELNIGVAKPSSDELQAVKHYFINSHSIHDVVNAAVFELYALDALRSVFAKHDVAVMVGGTGLYIKAFCNGIDQVPQVPATTRQNIIEAYQKNGLPWLQEEVAKNDPLYFANGETQNPQRLMRALEVKLSSGRSIAEFQTQQKKNRDFNIIKVGVELPRLELYDRINNRVDKMMEDGLLDEVQQLLPYQQLNALQTVGYAELFNYLEGRMSLEGSIEAIKQNSRHYAKRQMTWFKKDTAIQYSSPDIDPVLKILNQQIKI